MILSIDTSTEICSVAIHNSGELLAQRTHAIQRSHASVITLLIEEVVKESDTALQDLKAVAISKGPGSYTGLRVGVSTAKGLCYGLKKPLIAIPTLQAMALEIRESQELLPDSLLCPMIDARRMEVFCEIFNMQLETVQKTAAVILGEDSFGELLQQHPIYFFGNGSDKFKDVPTQTGQAYFIEDISPAAHRIGQLAWQAFQKKQFEDVAYFEPFYLKDFVGTVPKKRV